LTLSKQKIDSVSSPP